MNKPKPITEAELNAGQLPAWSERYAQWLSELPSFQNGTERARMGRIRAARALQRTVRAMLPDKEFPWSSFGWTVLQANGVVNDIIDTAKLKARATAAY